MPAGTRPPAPPPLPPAECKAVAVKHYEAGPPLGNELVEPGETVATTKEEEWVTKKTRELTTRRQIATRVQRQVVLEDGRVLQDSGPLVSTTTSEDTETHEHEHTEHRKLDDPPGEDVDAVDGAQAQIEGLTEVTKALANGDLVTQDGSPSKWVSVANPDGKVREIKERRVLTHEEIDERKETEERQHFGDITDEAYLKAVSSGREDIRQALRTCTDEDLSKALVASGPKLVHESSKTKKTIDTEDKEESRALHPSGDGRILTESKVTTEHEEINDEDLPDEEGKSLSSGSLERKKESGERWRRTKDQEYVDHMAGGARLAREMRYNADTEEGEKFGDPGMEDAHDWDSLSARVRRQRRQGQQKTLMQRQRDAETLQDRKDALTKKPLDFDLEEETRKKETSKWLEHHFGSDSRSSRDSIGDEIADEGPSTSYFNVTIKSQNQQPSHIKPNYVPEPPRAKSPLRQKIIHPVNNTPSRIFVPSPEPESVPSRTKGFFQGVSEWSQRKTDETRLRTDMSPRPVDSPPSSDHPRILRSPALQRDDSAYVSSSTVNTPYRRSSPERASPFQSLDRRDSPDRAYSPMHRQQYKQVAQPQYKAPIIDDDNIRYDRGPAPPERKRAIERKQRSSNDSNRYDSGYRSHSRNEASYREEMAEEPAPDYSPPRGARGKSRSPTRSPSPPQPARSSRKPSQRTRFEEPQAKKSVGAAIGQSIRKLVGKIRSASQERRGRQKGKRASRSPSPRNLSSTYQQYGSVDSDPPAVRGRRGSGGGAVNGGGSSGSRVNRAPDMERRTNGEPIQRYYLGEDPFGGSIYGRENKYDGARPQRSRKTPVNGHNGTNGDEHRTTFTTTLGRFSKSTSRLANNGNSSDEYMRNSQTLPRKLHDEQIQKKTAQKQYSAPQPPKQWENDRLANNKRSSSTINVSIVNVTPPSSALGVSRPMTNGSRLQGPIKPARTYKALNRSKSFNVHAMEPVNDIPKSGYFGNSSRLNSSSMYKSNPHLSRLDETPEQLKSPGIVSIISRSQRDLSNVVEREDDERKENVYSSRFAKKSSYTNGYNSPTENGVNDKKKLFLKSLQERSPELYQTLHGDDEIDGINGRGKSPTPIYNSTPIKNGYKKQTIYNEDVQYKSDPYRRDTGSPYRPINGVDKFKSSEGYASSPGYNVVRRGSTNSDNFSETYRTQSRSDDPRRPSVTNTVQTVSKKTIPSRDGRTKETIESTETTTVTKSRYVGDPMSNLKYVENGGRLNGLDHRRGSGQSINERRGSNGVIIDNRDYRK